MGKYKSQNNETEVALRFFGNKKITMLDIGANNGFDLSNSYDIIKLGHKATLVEPSSVYSELSKLHSGNQNVETFNVAIAKKRGKLDFYESGAHVKGGADKALVSTSIPSEMERWKEVDFEKKEVDAITFKDLLKSSRHNQFNYISIDVEGAEYEILSQINLREIGCKLLCIEYNGDKQKRQQFGAYCKKHGLKEIHKNSENLIYASIAP